ncbi:hypothetical protein KZL06_004951 [Salmonella enterica subsp. enterica serovar Teshie]|uniref:Uncharacterized protein n=1 Tax=Salmonella enterica TaxID=28901 RepID=A0A763SVB1_SALER|nr:hypothetical protein [Salmonella enterica]EHY8811109.1 hypothetical protein [Salmonella enterica subsp. enterica serovar Teshie]HBL9985709.1 hypothetical protein [Salmonella enterica subsp. enterica serovar Fomeco]EHU5047652.1 hypothetical protein [Salmonella enterica]EHU5819427.1 hypothetical protein [Salmonella enterica]EHU5827605.1 hypothetical protein [Salmonella enterica]
MNTGEATGVRIPEYVPARPDALAGQPDAGGELFLSRDYRNEAICMCTGHGLLLVLVGLAAMLAGLISPALS